MDSSPVVKRVPIDVIQDGHEMLYFHEVASVSATLPEHSVCLNQQTLRQGFVRVLGWGTGAPGLCALTFEYLRHADQCRVSWGYSRDGLSADPPLVLGSIGLGVSDSPCVVEPMQTARGSATCLCSDGRHVAMVPVRRDDDLANAW